MAPGKNFRVQLPLEIWREILIRVSVPKSIMRCRFVCKSWYSLVSSPDFISHYDLTNLNSTNHVLFRCNDYEPERRSVFSSHNVSFTESREHHEPLFLGRNLEIVGSCNGLICLAEVPRSVTHSKLMIWNPTIQKVVELPSRNFHPQYKQRCYQGFGFDPKTNDFKVLLGVCNQTETVLEIFDMRKGAWRRISLQAHSWRKSCTRQQCYFDGAIHWNAYGPDSGGFDHFILESFNLSDEVFREIEMPRCAEFTKHGEFTQTTIVASGGLIHLFVWAIDMDENFDMEASTSVWVMKEYGVTDSWTKISNIHLPHPHILPGTFIVPHTFQVLENDELLMVHDVYVGDEDEDEDEDQKHFEGRKQVLVLYNPGSREFKNVFPINHDEVSYMCLYKESLHSYMYF